MQMIRSMNQHRCASSIDLHWVKPKLPLSNGTLSHPIRAVVPRMQNARGTILDFLKPLNTQSYVLAGKIFRPMSIGWKKKPANLIGYRPKQNGSWWVWTTVLVRTLQPFKVAEGRGPLRIAALRAPFGLQRVLRDLTNGPTQLLLGPFRPIAMVCMTWREMFGSLRTTALYFRSMLISCDTRRVVYGLLRSPGTQLGRR